MCKIAILEDYALFCSGIRPVIEKAEQVEVVVEAKDLSVLLTQLKHTTPDLLIFDVIHSQENGLKSLKKIQKRYPKLPVLLVVNKNYSEFFEDYIAAGVKGIVCTSLGAEELIIAVTQVRIGQDYFPNKVWILLKDFLRTKRKDILPEKKSKSLLSERELTILKLFCKGFTYKEIGAQLNISPRTVETHKKNISTKLNVRSTAEMIEFAFQNNLN